LSFSLWLLELAFFFIVASRQPRNSEIGLGWDPISFARMAPGWLILLLAFIAGFWWQYRRLAIR
jgi:hypothetical protein